MADLLHLVDKPEGWTSHDAVARLRAILGEPRVGHAGTLDPFASGLLLVGEGRATGLLGCLGLLPKHYRAVARLGIATDTQDRTGAVTSTSNRIPHREEIESALDGFRGTIRQLPPLYSAVKVKGTRLYKAARRGVEVEREPRTVQVYELSLVDVSLPEVTLDLTVSRGTYVRTIAHDLGEVLGCGAHLASLRRLKSGPFDVNEAISCDREHARDAADLRSRALSLDRALSFLPRVRLDDAESARLRHGRAPSPERERIEVRERRWPLPPGERGWPLALLAPDGALLAIAKPWEAQTSGTLLELQRVLVGA